MKLVEDSCYLAYNMTTDNTNILGIFAIILSIIAIGITGFVVTQQNSVSTFDDSSLKSSIIVLTTKLNALDNTHRIDVTNLLNSNFNNRDFNDDDLDDLEDDLDDLDGDVDDNRKDIKDIINCLEEFDGEDYSDLETCLNKI